MLDIVNAASFMAHGYCLLWNPWLVSLHAIADLFIFLAYAAIPAGILLFLRRRPDIRLNYLPILFAAFILLCGLTHLFGLVTLWYPVYELQGIVKALTALVSVTTALVVFLLIPKLAALPSPAQLQESNDRLEAEIAAHRETLAELGKARQELEARVAERTAELEEANQRLEVLTREVVHRSKNLMTVVQSLASQTAASSSDKTEFLSKLSGRLSSLAAALDAVARGEREEVELSALIESQLEHYRAAFGERIRIDGPSLRIRPEAAQQIGLAVHELATNAVKYGALSKADGKVTVSWRVEEAGTEGAAKDGPAVQLHWCEEVARGKAPNRQGEAVSTSATAADSRAEAGFGTKLLEFAVPQTLRAKMRRELGANGFSYALSIPLAELRPRTAQEDEKDVTRAFPLAAAS
ncbi:sensor histidine kinase [Afifella pfennigii]|uniref:sensor histidine kinase n=1 Tax=Afifella pfennigii TaxID=209897 RepID=UPI00068D1D9A|nr:sensor histidine kinase [Afifella pfennigii]